MRIPAGYVNLTLDPEKVVDAQTVQLVIDHVDGKDLVMLAERLGIHNLERFVPNFSDRGPTEVANQVMKVWKERNGANATFKTLAESLVAVGRVDVVAQMKPKGATPTDDDQDAASRSGRFSNQ